MLKIIINRFLLYFAFSVIAAGFAIHLLFYSGNNYLVKAKFDNSIVGQNIDQESLNNFTRNCQYLKSKSFSFSPFFSNNKRIWQNICNAALRAENPVEFFKKYFDLYQIYEGFYDDGLLTGYYEIGLKGSRVRTEKFKYPVYKKPKDDKLLELSRSDIDFEAGLEGRDLEILYTDDLVRLFFLHIQGSGVVELENGESIYLGYAGRNTHEYSSIGKYFLEEGLISKEQISMQSIVEYLEQKPQEVRKILSLNKSYIFFAEKEQSATGALGMELIPEASIAVDRAYYPLGVAGFISAEIDNKPFNKLVFMHDTGSAIKTALRADLFMGRGKRAEQTAGKLKNDFKLYLLIPKQIDPRIYFDKFEQDHFLNALFG